ncbi:MAG: radical SAM protein [Anaerococcus sp.]|nr:B12-binding domain-containing radical SAM protein [Anaerococcus sp.]MDY2919435.1 radical SAM protein [Anaerococcus sp.]
MFDIIFVGELVIYNNGNSPYIGQLILNQILKDKGYNSFVFNTFDFYNDNDIGNYYTLESIEKVGNHILELDPKIISLYTVCETFPLTCLLAKYIKSKNDSIFIIFAGPHASLLGNEILINLDYVDIVAYSEGEYVVSDILNCLIKKNVDLSQIKGIYYRKEDEIVKTSSPELVANINLHKYYIKDLMKFCDNNSSVNLEGGRGCPYNCSFCTTSIFWKRKARLKPVEDLISEIEYYIERYRINNFNIIDDLFTSNRIYITDFCNKILEKNINILWSCSSRADTLDNKIIDLMKSSGLKSIYMGIESASDVIQNDINKNLNIGYAKKIIKYLANIGIDVTVSLIYGFANETLNEFKKTIDFYEDFFEYNNINLQLHIFSPYPKTEETNKVVDKLFLNEESLHLPLHQYKILKNKDCKVFVENNKELSSSFYDFDSEIRQDYAVISTLNEILMTMKIYFPIIIENSVKKIGMLKLYKMMEKDLKSIKSDISKIEEIDDDFEYKYINKIKELINEEYFKPILIGDFKYIYFLELKILNKLLFVNKKCFFSIYSKVNIKRLYLNKEIELNSGIYVIYGDLFNFDFSYCTNEKDYEIREKILIKSGYEPIGELNEL